MNSLYLILGIIIGLINIVEVIIMIAIKINDIKHLEREINNLSDMFYKNLVKIEDRLGKIDDLMQDHEKRLSRIEGKLNGK